MDYWNPILEMTNEAPHDPIAALIDELSYRSYAHNREQAPHISPQSWAKVVPNAEQMEERYQREKSNGVR
jgi:hypothetical protein